jgi:hypothetical protein
MSGHRRTGAPTSQVERMTGIEPALSAWEAEVLPLNYIRTDFRGLVLHDTHDFASRVPDLTRPRLTVQAPVPVSGRHLAPHEAIAKAIR